MRFGVHYYWNPVETSMGMKDPEKGKDFIASDSWLVAQNRLFKMGARDMHAFDAVLDVGSITRWVGRGAVLCAMWACMH
jgi:hypothetical protein